MEKTRHVLNVFLASPSDVNEERMLAEEVANSINKSAGRFLGWHIDLHRWEDTAPGIGRPQARINPMVDECDLFIGLLWERWGQPSGKYSSGFEEEFERARSRYKSENKPEIWLVFKEINPNSLKDPGDHLKKVIEFRKLQEDLREVLFKYVRDANDWKFKLYEWLLGYLLSLSSSVQAAEQQTATAVPAFNSPDAAAIESAAGEADQPTTPQQLKELASLLNRTLQSGQLDFSSSEQNPLRELDVVRLFLLSGTLMAHRYTSDVLGTHEINLLYKHREQLDVTGPEQYQLLRSFISDKSDVQPGWFWFHESIEEALLILAVRDSSDDVRIRALGLLGAARINIGEDMWKILPFNHDSWLVREATISYLGAVGSESALSFLQKLKSDDDSLLNSAIHDAELQILMRLDPAKALSDLLGKEDHLSDDQIRLLERHIPEVDEQALSKGIENQSEQVRKLSLKELIRRGALQVAVAQKCAAEDPVLSVRATAFQTLAELGALPDFDVVRKSLTEKDPLVGLGRLRLFSGLFGESEETLEADVDSIIVSFFRKQGVEKLLEALDWFSLEGPLAYRALALDHFDMISTNLRLDLANGFKRVQEESLRREEEKFGPEVREKIASAFAKHDDFIRKEFTKSALIALGVHAESVDATLIRPYLTLSDTSLRDLAVKIISKVGGAEDVDSLLKIEREAYGTAKNQAAAAALRLSSDPIQIAKELIESKQAGVRKIAFKWLFAQDSEIVQNVFDALMESPNDTDRLRALHYVSSRRTIKELEEFLKSYTARETYYYNVVTWLDRLVYAPVPLKGTFLRQLEQEAN